jgi:uncharacterized membrane protein YdbT with pleckstrin-like domain
MTSLFAKSTHIISLNDIEDVSFKQSGIFQTLFRLGSINMSTDATETTYTFTFVDTPTDEIKKISHLVSTAKKQSSSQ